MLSSKKSTLISCLLKRITSDVFCNHRPTPPSTPSSSSSSSSSNTGNHHQVCNKSKPLAGLRNVFSKCLQPAEEECLNNIQHMLLDQTKRLLQSLSTCELRHLWEAIQSGGRHEGECVLVPFSTATCSRLRRDEQSTDQCAMLQQEQQCEDQLDHRLLVSLQWRWSITEIKKRLLRPLPCCHHYTLGHTWRDVQEKCHSVCINPYHWALLIHSDYSLEDVSSGQPNDLTNRNNHQYYTISSMPMPSSTPPPSYSQDSTFDLPAGSHARNHKWCRLAYWEFRDRVGSLFPVSNNLVSVSVEPDSEDSISLLTLVKSRIHRASPPEVSKVFNKIGNGVSIFRDADNCVWLYNRSLSIIFVSSRTFDPNAFLPNGAPASSIMRVPPGHLIKAYDPQIAQQFAQFFKPNTHTTMLDNDTFSFSFGKGFGPGYSRPDILQCPCWFEVIMDFVSHSSDR